MVLKDNSQQQNTQLNKYNKEAMVVLEEFIPMQALKLRVGKRDRVNCKYVDEKTLYL